MIYNVGTNRIGSQLPNNQASSVGQNKPKTDFSKANDEAGKYLSNIDETQKTADASVTDMLTGKNNDLNSVVAEVAKADMSFKLLVGVRNKLVEAYKQTMSMQI